MTPTRAGQEVTDGLQRGVTTTAPNALGAIQVMFIGDMEGAARVVHAPYLTVLDGLR